MRAFRVTLTVLAACLLLIVTAGCSDGQVQRRASGGEEGFVSGSGITIIAPGDREGAVEFGGPIMDGGEFDLAAARGEVVVLNVWGSWCAPCREEAPALQAVNEELAPQGVRFVGVNTRDTPEAAAAFVEEFGITYPSVVDTEGRRLLSLRTSLPPNAIPSTLVIDREGRVAARLLGATTQITLRTVVSDVADEPVASGTG